MKSLGINIRHLRKQKHLTIKEVSKSTGIDIATLSRIETGKMTGTIESHMALAKCLGVSLPHLYENALLVEKKPKVATASEVHDPGMISSELLSSVATQKMLPVKLTIKPKSKTIQEKRKLGSERFCYCLEGRVEINIQNKKYSLKKNQSLYFNASVSHFFSNTSSKKCICLIVTTGDVQ